MNLIEDAWEQFALGSMGELGWELTPGAAIAPDGAAASGRGLGAAGNRSRGRGAQPESATSGARADQPG